MAKDGYYRAEPKPASPSVPESRPESRPEVIPATRLDPAKGGRLYKDAAGKFFVVVDTVEPEPALKPLTDSDLTVREEPKPEVKSKPKTEAKPKASKPKVEPEPEPAPKVESVPIPVVSTRSAPINGPAQAYRYLDREDGQWYITTNLFSAKQAGIIWEPVWAWFVDGAFHHELTGAEIRKYGL